MSIKYLSHTADIRMLIEAEDLQNLFTESIKGMSNILKEAFCDKTFKIGLKKMIEVSAADHTNLLIDFLSDVLSNSYIENVIYCNAKIIEFSDHTIKAEISGMHVEVFDEEIKAVTYHEANIKKNNKGFWETFIIFDI